MISKCVCTTVCVCVHCSRCVCVCVCVRTQHISLLPILSIIVCVTNK